jgi:hypothetical protein
MIGSAAVAVRWLSHREVRATCAIILTAVLGSLLMRDPIHGSVWGQRVLSH